MKLQITSGAMNKMLIQPNLQKFTDNLSEILKENHVLPRDLDELPYDLCRTPPGEIVTTTNSGVASNILDKMEQLIKMLQTISEVVPPKNESTFEVQNLDHEDTCITTNEESGRMVEIENES